MLTKKRKRIKEVQPTPKRVKELLLLYWIKDFTEDWKDPSLDEYN